MADSCLALRGVYRLGPPRRLVSPTDDFVRRCLRVYDPVVSPAQGVGWEMEGRECGLPPTRPSSVPWRREANPSLITFPARAYESHMK